MKAPTSYSWVGLGLGSSMSSADMLLVYTNGKGNVTLSPRISSGHQQPTFDGNLDVELLPGSGVENGVMTAHIRCGNCARSGVDFGSNSGSWIHARMAGSPLDSTNTQEAISEHSEYGAFTWDYRPAVGGASTNPFQDTTVQVIQGTASSSGSSGPNRTAILLCHGILASVAFLVLFPAGAIVMRLGNFKGLVWIHAGIQVFAWVVFVVAFGLGLWYGKQGNYMSEAHPIIGIVLFIMVTVQPLLGWVHHKAFLRTGGRTASSYGHIWMGRVAIILGMINGGLGLKLAGVCKQYVIAYSVVAGVMGLAFIASAVVGELANSRRRSSVGGASEEEKITESPGHMSERA
jgi:hypothetical protein